MIFMESLFPLSLSIQHLLARPVGLVDLLIFDWIIYRIQKDRDSPRTGTKSVGTKLRNHSRSATKVATSSSNQASSFDRNDGKLTPLTLQHQSICNINVICCYPTIEHLLHSNFLPSCWLALGNEVNSHKINATGTHLSASVPPQPLSAGTPERRIPLSEGLVEPMHTLNSHGEAPGPYPTSYLYRCGHNSTILKRSD